MKRLLIAVVGIALLAGCASDPGARRETIAKEQSGQLPAPRTPLSSYERFELKPMEMADSVGNDQAKAAVAKDLETRLQAVLQPMLTRWSAASGQRPARTLIVQPRVTSGATIANMIPESLGMFPESAIEVCRGSPRKMVRPAGVEPATLGLEVRCSIQLSYGRVGRDGQLLRQAPTISQPPRHMCE